ncbi:MAG: CHASE3 domain-containing protein [Alphaproteobacteria bacterium]|nr:CHASE3 domain-containing protein [Alphaproteobacteria bacterium]
MRLGLRTKMMVILGLLGFTSILNFGALVVTERNASKHLSWVLHTQDVIRQGEAFLGHMRDAETGQRGFLLTNLPKYLAPYDTGVKNARADLAALRTLTRDNPRQQKRLNSVQRLMDEKLTELADTIQLAQGGGLDSALVIVKTDAGRRAMDILRGEMQEFKAEESRLLRLRQSELAASQRNTRILFAMEALLLLSLITFIGFHIQKYLVSPILKLTENARRMAAGEGVEKISVVNRDEVGELVEGFEKMHRQVQSRTESLSQARQEAESANVAKSEFLAMMSHDLRTPLNAIIGFSDMIKSGVYGPIGDPRYSEYLEDINKSGMLLLSLINVVLDLAKIEAGKFELLEERVDLQSFLLSSVELISLQARERQIDLTFHAQEDFPNLQCDPRTLAQIVNNLLSNVIKFTEANGSVTVSTLAAQDGAILIRVEDSGIGMDEDGIKRALEPFGRVDSALTRSQEGTGLGLHVSKLLIERQGGSLDIESSPGEGTTVTARFPPERALAIGQNALAG